MTPISCVTHASKGKISSGSMSVTQAELSAGLSQLYSLNEEGNSCSFLDWPGQSLAR